MTQTENPALRLRAVNYGVGGHTILNNINLELAKGSVLGVIGPNGAGKTSLLKLISGQQLADDYHSVVGEISWMGSAVSAMSLKQKARSIAVVNQRNDLAFPLSLEHIVSMGRLAWQSLFHRNSDADEARLCQALDWVGLAQQRKTSFQQLSGGEQQRGLIARALLQQAELLVLDEPINHLDVYYQHQVLTLLRTLASEQNITVVMSLHDLNIAQDYCDTLCLLHHGQQVACGSAEQVINTETLNQVFKLPCELVSTRHQLHPRAIFYATSKGEKPC